VDDQKHPSCDCEQHQAVIRAGNDILAALSYLGREHGLCALNALVCAHILVVYMRDVISSDPDAERMNIEAARKAEDIYHYSQSHIEQKYGLRTTLSSKRGKLC
jgi:hypothetical protein